MTRVRKQLHFPATQFDQFENYVPKPSRDDIAIELFQSMPRGFVVVHYQAIATTAVPEVLMRLRDNESPKDMDDMLRVFASGSYGSAYHLYAEHALETDRVGDMRMYRQVKLPVLANPETGRRKSMDDLMSETISGFGYARGLATEIEEDLVDRGIQQKKDGQAVSLHHADNEELGSVFAHLGVELSVLHDHVDPEGGTPANVQANVLWAAEMGRKRAMELCRKSGRKVVTLAQLADEHSPLRRRLHDDRELMSQTAYTILLEEIESARKPQ